VAATSTRQWRGGYQAQPAIAQLGDPRHLVTQGIQDRFATATQRGDGLISHGPHPGKDLCVLLAGHPVHPRDGAARQDVVELVQQHHLPQPLQPGRGETLPRDAGQQRQDPQELSFSQRMLAAAVALLHLQLRGEDTAVELQVELTGVDRRIRPVLGACRLEERIGIAHRHPRCPLQIGQAPGPLHHLRRRAAPAVAIPERDHLMCCDPLLRVVVDGPQILLRGQLRVVAVDRREVRENPGAVDALPPHRGMRKPVVLVP